MSCSVTYLKGSELVKVSLCCWTWWWVSEGGKGCAHSVWSFFSVFWSNRQEVTKWSNIGMSCAYLPWHEYELHVELKVLHDALNLIPLPGGKKKQCQCQSQAHSKTGLTFASWTFWAGGENIETFCYVLSPQAQTRVNTDRSLETKTLFFTNTLELFTHYCNTQQDTNLAPTVSGISPVHAPTCSPGQLGREKGWCYYHACLHMCMPVPGPYAHACPCWPICTCLRPYAHACLHACTCFLPTDQLRDNLPHAYGRHDYACARPPGEEEWHPKCARTKCLLLAIP